MCWPGTGTRVRWWASLPAPIDDQGEAGAVRATAVHDDVRATARGVDGQATRAAVGHGLRPAGRDTERGALAPREGRPARAGPAGGRAPRLEPLRHQPEGGSLRGRDAAT